MSKIEITDFWKYIAAIAISCLLSFGGFYITNSYQYATKDDVISIVDAKILLLQNEMKHYDMTLKDLKVVIDNNNKVIQDFSKQLTKIEVLLELNPKQNAPKSVP